MRPLLEKLLHDGSAIQARQKKWEILRQQQARATAEAAVYAATGIGVVGATGFIRGDAWMFLHPGLPGVMLSVVFERNPPLLFAGVADELPAWVQVSSYDDLALFVAENWAEIQEAQSRAAEAEPTE